MKVICAQALADAGGIWRRPRSRQAWALELEPWSVLTRDGDADRLSLHLFRRDRLNAGSFANAFVAKASHALHPGDAPSWADDTFAR